MNNCSGLVWARLSGRETHSCGASYAEARWQHWGHKLNAVVTISNAYVWSTLRHLSCHCNDITLDAYLIGNILFWLSSFTIFFFKMKKWPAHITVYKCIIYCLVAFCLLLYSGIFLQQVSLEAMYQGRTCSHCPKRAPPYCKTSILSYPKISISKCCSRFRCECSNLQPAWTHLRCKLHLL